MQARVIGGFCLLAFLLSIGRAEEQESKDDPDVDQVKEIVSLTKSSELEVPDDLKSDGDLFSSEINLAVPQSNDQVNEERSGDVAQNARSFEDSNAGAFAQTSGDGYASAYADSNGGSSQSQAFASAGGAQATPFNHFNEELGPYKPSGSSFSQAEAQAIKSDSHGQGNSYPNPGSYPYYSGLQTQAQAQVQNGFYHRDKYGQVLSPGQAPNQAVNGIYQPGLGIPNVSPYNQGLNFPPGQGDSASFPYSQGISPHAIGYPSEAPLRPGVYNPNEAQGQPNAFVSVQSSAIAFVDAKSRVILANEYVFPNKIPGGENVIQCRKENEFHHFWSQGSDCLVCICFNEYGVLQPVCASCGGCYNPPPKLPEPIVVPSPFISTSIRPEPLPVPPSELYPPFVPEPYPLPLPEPYQTTPAPEPYPVYPEPVPIPSPFPVPFPEPVATLPPPPDQARCNPLPTGVPFTNPLHPCQICICNEGMGIGKDEVSIDCKDNPQCVTPADVTALPPLPDEPTPIPLPICEKFPEHVLFPHPTDSCKLCKCAKQLSEYGVYEQQLTCYPHPDCVPKPVPSTEAAPSLPIPVNPYHVNPYHEPGPLPTEPNWPMPLPDGVPVEPLPWPPITTISPVPPLPVTPRPGPLPGPSPHESCRPYPPNHTFQHPWDECQLCICTEATVVGMVTVEINCYTKPECCIELPDSVKTTIQHSALPGLIAPPTLTSNVVNSPDVPVFSSGPQPTTSTRPPPSYPSYSPSPVNIYPGSNTVTDPLNQAPPYSGYVDPAPSYPYATNYPSPYRNPQYSEYPPRLPHLPGTSNTISRYKPNNFGYPANYPYTQGDAVGNHFSPHGQYQPFDPRYQTVPAPSYSGVYQRYDNTYDRPHLYVSQLRDSYVKPPVPALGGPNLQVLAPSYATPIGYSKSGKDGPDEVSQ